MRRIETPVDRMQEVGLYLFGSDLVKRKVGRSANLLLPEFSWG